MIISIQFFPFFFFFAENALVQGNPPVGGSELHEIYLARTKILSTPAPSQTPKYFSDTDRISTEPAENTPRE